MKRRLIALLALAGSSCFAAASADLPEKWRSWRYSRTVIGNQSASDVQAELTLPWEIFGRCAPGCDDLRVINARGEEVPFLLQKKARGPRWRVTLPTSWKTAW